MDRIFGTIRQWGFRRGPRRVVGGICGGIAATWNLDVRVVRILMAIVFLLPGVAWIPYALAWLLLPWQDGSIPLEKLLSGGARSGR